MGYVKISDPNILDIAAWQQLINVVNQHSDSITALTNSFNGTSSGATDWNATAFSHVWDPGSQALVYGKETLVIASSGAVTSPAGAQTLNKVYYGVTSFSDPSISSTFQFSSPPVVTATLYAGSQGSGISPANSGCIITVFTVTTSGFSWRISSATSTAPTGAIPFYWQAVGPR